MGGIKPGVSPRQALSKTGEKLKSFFSPELPEVKTAEDIPKREDPAVQEAAAKERKLMRLRKGRQSTILTDLKKQTDQLGKQGL